MRVRALLPIAVTVSLAAPAAASAAASHLVTAGESLSSIAAADGLSVDQLAAANGLSPDAQLVSGSTVQIPAASSASAAGSSSAASASAGDGDSDDGGSAAGSAPASGASVGGGGYTVQPGDTLSAIASRAGVTLADLALANGIDPNAPLPAGAVLRVSGAGAASGSAASQPIGAVAQGSPGAPPYPTPERVSASEVGRIASAGGVPPSLAAAIGWQESGFNNDLVSSSDARGVMQILPGTWTWIQQSLAAGTLAPASAADNVRGGVLMLRSLMSSTGGDPALAAAGYYQGLASVRRYGLFPSTQQYVNSVLALRRRFGGG